MFIVSAVRYGSMKSGVLRFKNSTTLQAVCAGGALSWWKV